MCCLSINTNYPYASAIALKMQVPRRLTFTVNLRIPAWAAGASVRVNGRRELPTLEPGNFAAIQREWRSGDLVELELPLPLRLQSVDSVHPDTVALLAGPLVLIRWRSTKIGQTIPLLLELLWGRRSDSPVTRTIGRLSSLTKR